MNIDANEANTMLSIIPNATEINADKNRQPKPESAVRLAGECEALLKHIAVNGENALKAMEESIENMQESFVTALRGQLGGLGLNLDERIMLSLTEEGNLLMEGSFSGLENMDELTKISREFSAEFKLLAARAGLARSLERMYDILHAQNDACSDLIPTLKYKACLKGGLSHFYMGG